MTRWAWILITAGTLLCLASEAGAAEFVNLYSGNTSAKQQKVRQKASNSATTSVNSTGQQASSGTTSGPETGPGSNAPSTQAANAHASATTQESVGYKIGPLDVLDISVFQVPTLSKTVQVAANGNIDLPLVGETSAAGKTTQQLQQELNTRLGAAYLQNPDVTVVVKEANSSRATVTGAVNKPGVFPLTQQLSLVELITLAGGFSGTSDSTVVILRQSGGRRVAARFDVAAIQAGQARDPMIRSGDLVVAGESEMQKTLKSLDPIMKILPLAGMFALF